MSGEAVVVRMERVSGEDGHGADVVIDPSGQPITAPHYANPGVDALPLPGDFVALAEGAGAGAELAVGYADTGAAGLAQPGEVRLYCRNAGGTTVSSIWLKGDGTIVGSNNGGTLTLAPSGVLSVGGSADAAALASVVDAILAAIAACTPAVAVGPDAGEPGLIAIKAALAAYLTSASAKLKVGG